MRYFKIPFIQLENYECDSDIVKLIPEESSRNFQVIALEKWINILTVGMVNPEDEKTINILERRYKFKILPIRVNIQEWANKINKIYV